MIARVFAETGFKRAFRKILKLVITHQNVPDVIRLRNQWVPMDPRSWNAEMDMTITVGLGHGTKEQQVMLAQRLIEMQVRAIELQGGVQGPIVDADKIHASLRKWTLAAGLKDPDQYWLDPQQAQQQQQQEPPPDPRLVEAQGKMQLEQAKFQGDMQIEQAKLEQEMKIEQAKLEQQHALKVEEMKLNHQYRMEQLSLKREEVAMVATVKEAEAEARLASAN